MKRRPSQLPRRSGPPDVGAIDLIDSIGRVWPTFMTTRTRHGAKYEPTRRTDASAPTAADAIVLVSMALVVAAIVVGLHLQVGLPIAIAGLMGLSLFLALAGFQALQRSQILKKELAEVECHLAAEAQTAAGRESAGPTPAATVIEPQTTVATVPQTAPHAVPSHDRRPSFATPHPTAMEGEQVFHRPTTGDMGNIAAHESPRPSAVREDDVEMLQERIKDMLRQVSAAEAAETTPRRDLSPLNAEPQSVAALGIEASLSALRTAARTMRGTSADFAYADRAPDALATSDSTATSGRPSPEPVQTDLAATHPTASLDEPVSENPASVISEAIAAGRVDVFLEPILALSDQSTQHYEVTIRVRGMAGENLGGDGNTESLTGRGLLPLFDAARIARSTIIAERLAAKGREGSVFTATSGESLTNSAFSRDIEQTIAGSRTGARQLVLTFTQSDIRTFRPVEQRAVAALGALGFRFAISGLTDLDMNFEAMAKAGFGFVKVDAQVLIEGLPYPGGHIPPDDVLRYLAAQGFAVIVDNVDSEETLARIFGFGAVLGKGALFGGPRPVRADVVGKPNVAAA